MAKTAASRPANPVPAAGDFEAMTIEQLEALISGATAALNQKRDTRRAELLAELERLGGLPKPARGSRPAEDGDRKRASPKPVFKAPNGFEWSGRGAIPKAFRELGVNDKSGMEKYRIPA